MAVRGFDTSILGVLGGINVDIRPGTGLAGVGVMHRRYLTGVEKVIVRMSTILTPPPTLRHYEGGAGMTYITSMAAA